ncbi:hypothetical protein GQ600_12485 [Phytophthora cactorum]|nr:hypothetical protein GQ600_12485 [Phytophthora cactorum]
MSDTTPSAKNVADHLGTEQEGYTMYLLNLCIGYGIGLKDNIQTSSWLMEQGGDNRDPCGALDEGGSVIQKLRNLSNHFRPTKQLNALKMAQKALSYP